ncbi:SLIT-ROBO Rho GTPase-activating protein 1-like [Convolutriloba macropyga]|uniref:SLIT-ROBO Rho GTPase-activating protein 1-like n=1 Tax=Convolutriloba macropyga TaxID=536237 RepID=UPI003F527F23
MNLTEKQAVSQLEGIGVDAKNYLGDQLKVLDNHLNQHLTTCTDIKDFLKKKAEIDSEYSKKLEKLTDQYISKLNAQINSGDNRRGNVSSPTKSLSGYQQCFYSLLNISKQTCYDVNNDSQLTSDYIMDHFATVTSVLKHMFEQSRVPLQKCHEEFLILANQLTGFLKSYQQSHQNYRQENAKFEAASVEFDKVKSAGDTKGRNAGKLKSAEKKRAKCQMKRDDAFSSLNKNRNEYLLAIQAMNYFLNDIYNTTAPQTVDAMFLGHFDWSQCVFKSIYLLQEESLKKRSEKIREFRNAVNALNMLKETSNFMEENSSSFTPKENLKFAFTPHSMKGFTDEISVLCLDASLKEKYDQIKSSFATYESQVKDLDTSLAKCRDNVIDIVGKLYLDNSTILDSFTQNKEKSLNLFTQNFDENIERLRDQQQLFNQHNTTKGPLANSCIRLKGRKDIIESMFGVDIEINVGSYNTVSRNRRRLRGPQSVLPSQLKPKYKVTVPLFGGKIETYCATAQIDIPPVVTSCINRIVNTPGGLTHSGIFRLNGSQSEINNLKGLFDKNEDPLEDDNQAWNWNTIAGLLKLYFRELEEPLFPKGRFTEVINTLKLRQDSESDFLSHLTFFVSSLNVNVMITMRYLFDFLKCLSRYSDQNMMDDYNLAVCWGPTLLPIPEDFDQVLHHNDVIELIQTFINQSYQIFPRNYGLLLDDMADSLGPGSVSEGEPDIDETDDEMLDDPDSLKDDTTSTYSMTSHNAPDLVMDLPANATVDSSESGENICSSPVPSLASSTSNAGVSLATDVDSSERPRAISLNIDVDPVVHVKSSPMLAARKLELEKLGGMNLGEPKVFPRKTASNKVVSPTGSSQASISTTGSSESLKDPAMHASASQITAFKSATSSSSSATASPAAILKSSIKGVSSPTIKDDAQGDSAEPSAGTPSTAESKVFPPPVLPKPTFKK